MLHDRTPFKARVDYDVKKTVLCVAYNFCHDCIGLIFSNGEIACVQLLLANNFAIVKEENK